jgi:hypothetical protein
VPQRQADRLVAVAVAGLADDRHVVLLLDQGRKAAAQQHLVVGQQHADGYAGGSSSGRTTRTWNPPSAGVVGLEEGRLRPLYPEPLGPLV